MEQIKEIKLTDCPGMMKAIAAAMIKEHGEYRCTVGGIKTVIRE